jgi:putative exosortase-associated protein (TIGR04073 family)
MRTTLCFLAPLAALVLIVAGCSNVETKMGRGMANTAEIVRLGELQRSVEQHGVFDGTDVGVMTGVVEGMDRSLARTGLGIYEVVTAPLPPYHPVLTNYLSPKPGYPDAYQPRKWADPVFDTDHALGFSGGDIAPWFPGSRFRVFDN